jgi:hypothetical protein
MTSGKSPYFRDQARPRVNARVRALAAAAMHRPVADDEIEAAADKHADKTLRVLRQKLADDELALKRAGGRGDDLAMQIDSLRIVVAIRGRKRKPKKRVVRYKLRRYALFVGSPHDPAKFGWGAFHASYSNGRLAKEAGRKLVARHKNDPKFQVVDITTGRVVKTD